MAIGDDNVNVQITGSVAGLNAAMAQGATAVQSGTAAMTSSIKTMTTGVAAAMGPLVALLALFKSFSAISDAVSEVTDLAVSLDVLSAKTGLSVESLSALHGAATLGNLPVAELDGGMQRLARGMDEAAKGAGPVADAFKRLGVSATDASGQLRPTRDVMLDLANRFSTLEDGAAKTALGIAIFGRGFDALGQFLNKGSEGIKALEEQALSLGGVMTAEAQASLLAYDDAMDRIEVTVGGLKRELVVGLAPALTAIASSFTAGAGGMDTMRNAGAALGNVLRGLVALFTTMNLSMNVLVGLAKGGFSGAAEEVRKYREEMEKLFKAVDPLANDPSLFALVGGPKGTVAPSTEASDKEAKRLQDALEQSADIMAAARERWKEANKKAQDELAKGWVDTFNAIPNAWRSAVQSLRGTTASWGQFFKAMLADLTVSFASWAARKVIIHNAAWLEQKKTTALGWAFEKMEAIAATIVDVAQSAYRAAARAWAWAANIDPIFLAPAVALATLAGVLAIAHGGGGGGGGGGAAAPATAIAPSAPARSGGGNTYYISTMDAKSFHDFALANGGTFAKAAAAGAASGVRLPASAGRGSA